MLRIGTGSSMQGDELWLEVVDNDSGIAPEAQQCIFEPSFTTKPIGTGLTLIVSYGIAVTHQGNIEVASVVEWAKARPSAWRC